MAPGALGSWPGSDEVRTWAWASVSRLLPGALEHGQMTTLGGQTDAHSDCHSDLGKPSSQDLSFLSKRLVLFFPPWLQRHAPSCSSVCYERMSRHPAVEGDSEATLHPGAASTALSPRTPLVSPGFRNTEATPSFHSPAGDREPPDCLI